MGDPGVSEAATADQVVFVTNGDGTVDCAWCGKIFSAEAAHLDDGLDPICLECFGSVEDKQ